MFPLFLPSPLSTARPLPLAPLSASHTTASFTLPGAVVNCVVEIENGAVCCETFEACPQLGRFTLRDEGKTIGIGKILEMLDMSDDSK